MSVNVKTVEFSVRMHDGKYDLYHDELLVAKNHDTLQAVENSATGIVNLVKALLAMIAEHSVVPELKADLDALIPELKIHLNIYTKVEPEPKICNIEIDATRGDA